MQWYVLYTNARAEKQAEKRLRQMNVETYLPLHLSPRRWSDRIKMVEAPLFSSYIFVKTKEDTLRSLTAVQGISRIIYYNGKPAVVREKEIASIQSFLEKAREREVNFAIDDEVRIACGPLKDISGKIKTVRGKYLVLHLEQLGATVSVSIAQIVKNK